MKYFGEGLSEKQKELSGIIRKKDRIGEVKSLFLEIHGQLHRSNVSSGEANEVDRLFADLERREYAVMPSEKDETIAWVLWHISRIEDLTMGILAAGSGQLFCDEWKDRLCSPIRDTGNALTDDEIMKLSKTLDIQELLRYRDEVGKRTRQIAEGLNAEDMRRKVSPKDLETIRLEGGVTSQEESLWLLDFWGKKDVAGILLMPPTRHVILHLNDCSRWKGQIRTKKKFFRT